MSETANKALLVTGVRLSFPNIWKASSFSPDQEKKFSATLIVRKDDKKNIAAIKAAMEEVAVAKWGSDKKKWPKGIKPCLRDGDEEKGHLDGFEDTLFFNASNAKRPSVYDRDRTPLTEEDGYPYAGCYVNVMVEFWAQDNQYGKRINATLKGVQFVDHGEAFGGGGAPAGADEFPELDDLVVAGGSGGDDSGYDQDFLS